MTKSEPVSSSQYRQSRSAAEPRGTQSQSRAGIPDFRRRSVSQRRMSEFIHHSSVMVKQRATADAIRQAGSNQSVSWQGREGSRLPGLVTTIPSQQVDEKTPLQEKSFTQKGPVQARGVPGPRPNRAPKAVVQRKPETVAITGVTHLVAMDDQTIWGGEEYQTVREGDRVTIERSNKYKSRRGPNQETYREIDETGPQHYIWYQVTSVNGKRVKAKNIYLRDETFVAQKGAAPVVVSPALNAARSAVAKLKTKAGAVYDNLREVLTVLDEHPGVLDFETFQSEYGMAEANLKSMRKSLNLPVPNSIEQAHDQLGRISGHMKHVSQRAQQAAYEAKASGDPDVARLLIRVADSAFVVSGESLQETMSGGTPISTSSDNRADILGYVDTGQTALGGVGVGILTAPGVATSTTATAVATGFGYVAGPLGVVFGLVGLGLGIRAAWRGFSKEKELGRLVHTLDSEKIKRIALYAKEQKRRKKWGGAITITASVGAIAGGVLGIAALSVATLGVGAAILGIGAALIGLGIGVVKLIHRIQKRKKWKNKMAALVIEAVREGKTVDGNLSALARAVTQGTEGSQAYKRAFKALGNACAEKADSRRELLGLAAVRALVSGTPGEQYDAILLMDTLGVDTEKVKVTAAESGDKAASGLVSRKMKSW